AATGLYVYTQVGDDLSRALDQDLRLRGQDLSVVVAHRAAPLTAESGGRLIERGESFAQLLDERGRVLDATRPIGRRPLIGPAEQRRALRGATFVNRPAVPGHDELRRLGTTLNDMLARLEDALESERQFVADAGHELRTPLALLRAELDYALQHAEDEAELRDALTEASAETDRLVQLSGDLLL